MNTKETQKMNSEASKDKIFALYKIAVKVISVFEQKGFEVKRFKHPNHLERFHFHIVKKLNKNQTRTASMFIEIDDKYEMYRIEVWGWDEDEASEYYTWDLCFGCDLLFVGDDDDEEELIKDLNIFFDSEIDYDECRVVN